MGERKHFWGEFLSSQLPHEYMDNEIFGICEGWLLIENFGMTQ